MPFTHPMTPRNRILAALPPEVLASLLPKLAPVSLKMRQIVYQQDGLIDAVYFPEAGMFSMVTNLVDGMQAEVGVIGSEGMTGLPLLAGVTTSFVETMVQMPGVALQMSARQFKEELQRHAILRFDLMRYSEALQSQVMQTAACNGRHDLEARLARWLLMAQDRFESNELPLTHDLLAMMLGVHRPSITIIAGILQRAGLIRYRSGRITILDRLGLESAACECYGAVVRRTALLLQPEGELPA
jgi:CRP-like cAMP-binding protein